MTSGAIFTLVFEISFVFLVWNRRLRPVLLISAVLLHTGIAVFMGLVTFSLMMMTALLSFVPAEAVHRLLARLAHGTSGPQLTPLPGPSDARKGRTAVA
jgi:hypothetical protein